ncbi:phenylacetic acid degradation protein PaaY [Marinovum sp.]|uniref:gamma carbonic anhydrase family protein n=1 Tax=Marinovum sp. TaxID=2024839 RepID=UPI002B266605|nr:phenylacetic acid degradation protein PaaY [Marinovum sp.]
MPVYAFEGCVPVLHPTAFLHPTAVLIGDVQVGARCYIGAGAALRGDFGRITVADHVSVQDSCTLHSAAGSDCVVAEGTTISHGAVLHGCRIGTDTLVGINAVVLDEADIGAECLIGAMTLVRSEMVVPARHFVAGNPARIIRELAADRIGWAQSRDGEYPRLADRCRAGLVECAALSAPEDNRPRNTGNAQAVRLKEKE